MPCHVAPLWLPASPAGATASGGLTWPPRAVGLHRQPEAIGPDPNLIRPGTILGVPGTGEPSRYTVAPGDTLAGIAAALGMPGGWQTLYTANRQAIGPDPDLIRPGTVLAAPLPAAPSPGARGQAPGSTPAPSGQGIRHRRPTGHQWPPRPVPTRSPLATPRLPQGAPRPLGGRPPRAACPVGWKTS